MWRHRGGGGGLGSGPGLTRDMKPSVTIRNSTIFFDLQEAFRRNWRHFSWNFDCIPWEILRSFGLIFLETFFSVSNKNNDKIWRILSIMTTTRKKLKLSMHMIGLLAKNVDPGEGVRTRFCKFRATSRKRIIFSNTKK